MALDSDYDVFISYSSKDKAWVRGELLSTLESHGLRAIIDFRDFRIGAPTIKEIERAILSSRKTLLVLSPDYLTSQWTEFENLLLQTLDPSNQTLRLLPLLKEKCDLPLRIRALTYVSFVDPEDEAFVWKRLLAALGSASTLAPTSATSTVTKTTGVTPTHEGKSNVKLSGKQFAALSQALLDSFDQGSLTRMVRIELDEDLGHIASPGSLTQVVDELVKWSERTNRVQDLITGACTQNSGNVLLQELKSQTKSEGWFETTIVSHRQDNAPSQVEKVKRKALEEHLVSLTQEYEAANNQMSTTLNAADKVKLQRQLDTLEQEVQAVEAKLNHLQ